MRTSALTDVEVHEPGRRAGRQHERGGVAVRRARRGAPSPPATSATASRRSTSAATPSPDRRPCRGAGAASAVARPRRSTVSACRESDAVDDVVCAAARERRPASPGRAPARAPSTARAPERSPRPACARARPERARPAGTSSRARRGRRAAPSCAPTGSAAGSRPAGRAARDRVGGRRGVPRRPSVATGRSRRPGARTRPSGAAGRRRRGTLHCSSEPSICSPGPPMMRVANGSAPMLNVPRRRSFDVRRSGLFLAVSDHHALARGLSRVDVFARGAAQRAAAGVARSGRSASR